MMLPCPDRVTVNVADSPTSSSSLSSSALISNLPTTPEKGTASPVYGGNGSTLIERESVEKRLVSLRPKEKKLFEKKESPNGSRLPLTATSQLITAGSILNSPAASGIIT